MPERRCCGVAGRRYSNCSSLEDSMLLHLSGKSDEQGGAAHFRKGSRFTRRSAHKITPKTRRETPNREEREHPHLSVSTSSFRSRDFAIESTMFRLRVGKDISSLHCFRSRGPGNHPRRLAILPWATKVVSAALPRVAPHVGLTKHEQATTSFVIMLGASFN